MRLSRTGVGLFLAATAFATLVVPSVTGAASAQAVTEPYCYTLGGEWCIWSGTNGTGTEVLGQSYSDLLPDRNQDESVENGGAPYDLFLRLYYSPNLEGAWVCINPGVWLANTSDYTFNNGQGDAGYGTSLWRNVASVRFNTDPCTNPTGG